MPRPVTSLRVAALPGRRGRGRLTAGGVTVACALGPAGVRRDKREGDGATPAGRFRLLRALFRPDRPARPRLSLPQRAIRRDDGWCDDPARPAYNRPARLPCVGSSENLWRDDRLYDVIVVLDHNQRPRVRGRGSAIFLHVAREGYAPTAGCVAIAPDDLRRLLPRLARRAALVIV